MSIYRKNAKPEELPPTFWNKLLEGIQRAWLFMGDMAYVMKQPVLTAFSWVLAAAFIGSIVCLIAMLAQWVVTGFVGHEVGQYWHYVGAIVLYSVLTSRLREESKRPKDLEL